MTEKLREIVGNMTPGPFRIHQPKPNFMGPQILTETGGILFEATSYGKSRADALGVVTLRNIAPELLDVVEAAEMAAENLDKLLDLTGQELRVTINGQDMIYDATGELKEALERLRAKVEK